MGAGETDDGLSSPGPERDGEYRTGVRSSGWTERERIAALGRTMLRDRRRLHDWFAHLVARGGDVEARELESFESRLRKSIDRAETRALSVPAIEYDGSLPTRVMSVPCSVVVKGSLRFGAIICCASRAAMECGIA